MRKLKLSIDSLEVDSFQTSGARAEGRGTVAACMPKPGGTVVPLTNTYYVGDTCECTLETSCPTRSVLECEPVNPIPTTSLEPSPA